MFKRCLSILLIVIGFMSLLEAVGRGGGMVQARGRVGEPYAYPSQRTPSLSRAYRYSDPYGYSSGGTTIVEPTYPPYGQYSSDPEGPYYPQSQGSG